jgi:hypothetical protein
MKKVILGIILVIVLIIAGGVYYVLTNLDALVKAAIEHHGSQATQTAVRVDKVRIDLREGAGAIHGLTIANPKGFADSYAFSLGEISTRIDLASLKEEPYVIDEITVRAPRIFMEINKDKKTNLNELKKNLTATTGATSKATPGAEEKASKHEPRLIIRRVVFSDGNIQARVVPLNNKEYQLKFPNMEMTNLGGKTGATPGQLASEILNRLTDQAREIVKQKGIGQELDKIKSEAKAKVEEEKARLKQEADSKLEAEKQKASEKLKGLLGK